MEVIPTRIANNTPVIPKIDYCFDLELGESNVETYPEFSWKELVKDSQAQKGTERSAEGKNSDGRTTLDPYASDDEDDLRALAAKFEKKYNNDGKDSKGKRRKRKAQDYIDRGAGYDETDSFIDNSEVYDEVVPEDIQPVHGGFYINSGRLDFKDADVSDCDVDEEIEEQRLTTGRKFSKSVIKKGLPQAKARKKKRTSDKDEPPKSVKGNETNPNKKASESPKPSGSDSPVRSSGKTKTITISSDSSSSDSSGSTSSSSSDSEKEDDSSPAPKPSVTVSVVPPIPAEKRSVPANNQPPRRLKVKNVPLNPKLHADSPPTPHVQQSSSAAAASAPQNNREIFGSVLPSAAGPSIATVSSTTSILPSSSRPVSSSKPKVPNTPSPKSYAAPSPVPVHKPKIRKRVTDRLPGPGNLVKKPVATLSPSTPSPLKKKQKTDPLPAAVIRPQQGTAAKKPRKPRVTPLNSTPPTPASSATVQRPLTPEEQHRMILQHLQRHPQLSSLGLGLSHLLPMLASTAVPTIPPTNPSPKEQRRQQPQAKSTASDVLKNLASFQTQVGSGVTVSEVKKTKPHSLSPSAGMATISPKSTTPPSRLSTPSPINIPRIPIPSSITVTASTPRSQHHHRTSTTTIPQVASPPTGSPNLQTVQNTTSKTFTDFHMNALLSKPFNSSTSSGK